MEGVMNDEALARALFRALLILRVTLGVFLLQWGIEKFVMPGNTPEIWGHFYGIAVPQATAYIFGAAEIAIAVCLLLGVLRTFAYGAALVLHAVTVLVSWRQLLDPWGDPVNHLFIASVPVLGAFLALFLLRHWDRPLIGAAQPVRR
jgi:putative oxidoreductase